MTPAKLYTNRAYIYSTATKRNGEGARGGGAARTAQAAPVIMIMARWSRAFCAAAHISVPGAVVDLCATRAGETRTRASRPLDVQFWHLIKYTGRHNLRPKRLHRSLYYYSFSSIIHCVGLIFYKSIVVCESARD
ncbi:hypothetical protein EVAR_75868_1 [Eumeta japonica]|uniref:Uncharacterized protein n=1 Tax=Eumeta variegata TaxID=151549 RepID=A0A4C1TFW1_EUMVA|nr:hypothetical protein EVAR_75868_1 [Eumeta japonica]